MANNTVVKNNVVTPVLGNTIVWKGQTLPRMSAVDAGKKFDQLKVVLPMNDEMADMIMEIVPAYQTKDDGSVRSHDWDCVRNWVGTLAGLKEYVVTVSTKPVTPRGQGNPVNKMVKALLDKGMSREELAEKMAGLLK